MPSLAQKIQEDLKNAMRAREAEKLSTLRMLAADLKNKMIEKRKQELGDDEVQDVIRASVKRRKDSIESYRSGGREDLAKKEEAEATLLQAYLPALLSEEEVKKLAKQAVEKVGATSLKDFGKVMGVLMKEVKGKADGAMVKKAVETLLKTPQA